MHAIVKARTFCLRFRRLSWARLGCEIISYNLQQVFPLITIPSLPSSTAVHVLEPGLGVLQDLVNQVCGSRVFDPTGVNTLAEFEEII